MVTEYEIIIRKSLSPHRSVATFSAEIMAIYRHSDDTVIKDSLGLVDVSFHEAPDRDKVRELAIEMVERLKGDS